jgi:hypothetical protein
VTPEALSIQLNDAVKAVLVEHRQAVLQSFETAVSELALAELAQTLKAEADLKAAATEGHRITLAEVSIRLNDTVKRVVKEHSAAVLDAFETDIANRAIAKLAEDQAKAA